MATEAEKNLVKEELENDMMKKIKEMFGGEAPVDGAEQVDEVEPTPPLEEAIERALHSLSEIAIYGTYGRSEECAREAQEAYDIIKALKEKYDEQNQIIDALSGRLPTPELESEDD